MAKTSYTPEFKREAVRLARSAGTSLPKAAKELGLHVNTLRGWVHNFKAGKWQAEPGTELKSAEAKEIERLKRELDRVTMERDILKKATAYFAKESK